MPTLRRTFAGFRSLNMLGLAAISLLSGASCALAQEPEPGMYYNSYIAVNPADGTIGAYGFTEVGDSSVWEEYIVFETASVEIAITGQGSDSATDNCDTGCAEAWATGQVGSLGTTYAESSGHVGEIEYDYGEPFYDFESWYDSYDVPGYPSISLQGIDATNPHLTQFSYYVTGPMPYSATLQLGDATALSIADSNPMNLYLDQGEYPDGTNLAQMIAYTYGIYYGAGGCYVTSTQSAHLPTTVLPSSTMAATSGAKAHQPFHNSFP